MMWSNLGGSDPLHEKQQARIDSFIKAYWLFVLVTIHQKTCETKKRTSPRRLHHTNSEHKDNEEEPTMNGP